jgi:pSer/pThr/pTyr-binding forkhead associated (FHA) protein
VNDDEIYIEDLGSTNGISVNAQAVQRQRLHDGDIVDVGGAQLRFVDPTERATAGSGPEPN